MKITIYSGELTPTEAKGLVAFLIATHGPDIIPATLEKVGDLMRVTGPATINVTNQVSETPAADGFPATLDHPAGVPMPPPYEGPVSTSTIAALDSDGVPWDERIHSGSKGTNKDGTWTRKRNTPDELFNSVMAELKARTTAPVGVPTGTITPPPPPPAVVTPEPTAAAAFSDEGTRTAGPAVIPAPPPPAAPAVTGSAPTFVQIMSKVTAAQKEGKLDKAKLDELLATCGLVGVAKLVSADEGTRAAFDALLTDALK